MLDKRLKKYVLFVAEVAQRQLKTKILKNFRKTLVTLVLRKYFKIKHI